MRPRARSEKVMTDVFDQRATLVRMGEDYDLFREMIAMLLEDGPGLLQQITAAAAAQDADQVALAAHCLKGLSANFSAGRAIRAAANTERLASHEDWPRIEASIPELRDAFHELS